MSEKVMKVGLIREQGFLYFVDKNGNISKSTMSRGKKKFKAKHILVKKLGIEKDSLNYLYYVDKEGDVSRAKLVRRDQWKKKKD